MNPHDVLRRLRSWLRSGSPGVPDIERQALQDYIRRAPAPEQPMLHDVLDRFDDPRSGCPDACIGAILEECDSRAAVCTLPEEPLTDAERMIVGRLSFGPESLDSLIWTMPPEFDHDAVVEAARRLVEAGLVIDTGVLTLAKDIP